jgi:hypothetical protein
MIKRIYLTVYFLIFGYIGCTAQAPDYFPTISEIDLPGATFTTPRTFSNTSLFGYMNGGAELYLEYGFSGARVNEIEYMGGTYILEIYRMNGPEEAFGIFSVSRFQCKSIPSFAWLGCQTAYQVQFCSGSFYVNIINNSGSRNDSIASLKIGEAIFSKIMEKPAQIDYYLPGVSPETINRHAILVKGQLGIMNGAQELSEYFGELSGYTAVILQEEGKTRLSICFDDKEKLQAFASLHSWKPDDLSHGSLILPTGDTITRISENHLLINMR